ncbi:restriction endonuclease subunit S [Pseudomonas sp. LB3P93]
MSAVKMQRYAEYKDSGVEWVGETPSHWLLTRNKEIFLERGSLSQNGDETLLTVSHITGVTLRSEKNVNMFMAETMEGYKHCKKGDLVINTMWAWMGALGTANEDGICSPAYGVYAPRRFMPYNPRYFDYLYRTPSAISEMTRNSKGIVSSRLRLYPKDFFQILTALPPYQEQTAIANYLDIKTAQIERQIDLLSQKATQYGKLKQSLINETVTLGLDKLVPMKDSGVEWLGEIPSSWKLQRHKDAFQLISSRCLNPSSLKVALENIEGKTGRFISSDTEFAGDGVQFKKNDILFGKLRPYLAKVYLAEFSGNAIGDIFVYRSRPKVSPQFAAYLMRSDRYIDVINSSTAGAKMPRASSGFIADLPVAIPLIAEQTAIAAYLDSKTDHIDRIVTAINTQIDKLKELRKALINDVVTGKIKVVSKGTAA